MQGALHGSKQQLGGTGLAYVVMKRRKLNTDEDAAAPRTVAHCQALKPRVTTARPVGAAPPTALVHAGQVPPVQG